MEINPKIFKAYDIRGAYPDEINKEAAYDIGRALSVFFDTSKIVVGRDMRESSEVLFDSLARGLIESGVEVLDIGLVGTEILYFAAGKYELPGVMITASHLTGKYNGMKICKSDVVPLGGDSGLGEIKRIIEDRDFAKKTKPGEIIKKDVLSEYIEHVSGFVDISKIRPLNIVADAGNGMAGKVLPLLFKKLPCRVTSLYFRLDSDFPNHEPDPLVEENLRDLQLKVKETKADLGVAFDGDGDRLFFVDEAGEVVSSSFVIALFAEKLLKENLGEKIIYNVVCSKIVPEMVRQNGGEPVLERVGHAFIKNKMKETGAIFGGEHSGHYYFRYNFKADSGLLALLLMFEILSGSEVSLSELIKPYKKYFRISETNFEVEDKIKTLQKIEEIYNNGEISKLDGLSIVYDSWWFNLRPSNTEPVLRLNMEAKSEELLEEKFKEISNIIKNH
jgi:phosphomannomutase